jgi:hypothetical protein
MLKEDDYYRRLAILIGLPKAEAGPLGGANSVLVIAVVVIHRQQRWVCSAGQRNGRELPLTASFTTDRKL